VRVAREKGRRRGALAAKQESELAAAQAEVAATKAAAESAQCIANAAADNKKRLQVLSLEHAAQSGVALLALIGSHRCMHSLLRSTCRCAAPATACDVAGLRYASLQAELEELQGKLAEARQSLEGNDQMIRWLNNQVGRSRVDTDRCFQACVQTIMCHQAGEAGCADVMLCSAGSSTTRSCHTAALAAACRAGRPARQLLPASSRQPWPPILSIPTAPPPCTRQTQPQLPAASAPVAQALSLLIRGHPAAQLHQQTGTLHGEERRTPCARAGRPMPRASRQGT
jgi:hypothetical protein